MLEHDEQPPHTVQEEVERQSRALESVWNRDTVIPILLQWFQSLPVAADGRFTGGTFISGAGLLEAADGFCPGRHSA